MKYLVLLLVLLVGAFIFFQVMHADAPFTGLLHYEGQEVLGQRARPCVLFVPRSDAELIFSGVKNVRPEDFRLRSESVRLSLALYRLGPAQGAGRTAQLVTALAECPGEWEWEAGHHSPYKSLRSVDEPYGKERLYETLYLLTAAADPFALAEEPDVLLVYRAKFVPFFRKVQILFEYRELLTKKEAELLDLQPDRLKAFAERGRTSCRVLFAEKEEGSRLMTHLSPLKTSEGAAALEREKLARWLGVLQHPGANR